MWYNRVYGTRYVNTASVSDFWLTNIILTLDNIDAEVVNQVPYDMAIDWWSVGVLCFELLTGATPFSDESEAEEDATELDKQGEISRRIILTEPKYQRFNLSNTAVEFISKLLCKNPQKRLGKKRR